MRTFFLIVFLLTTVAGAYLTYRMFKQSEKSQGELNHERYNRMNAEELLSRARKRVSDLEADLLKYKKKLETKEQFLLEIEQMKVEVQTQLDQCYSTQDLLNNQIMKLQQASTR